MKKLILGVSAMISGILLTCTALITGGLLASGANVGSDSGMFNISDFPVAIAFIVIGSLLTLFGLIVSSMEAFTKSSK